MTVTSQLFIQIKLDKKSALEITQALEPLIRRIIREELIKIVKKESDIFLLTPEMPLYKDMKNIKQRKARGHIKLHSHDEVWGD